MAGLQSQPLPNKMSSHRSSPRRSERNPHLLRCAGLRAEWLAIFVVAPAGALRRSRRSSIHRSSQVCSRPALTEENVPIGGVACPSSLLPQQATERASRVPKGVRYPAARSYNGPGT